MTHDSLTIARATGVRSMTGQGRATGQTDLGVMAVELRTVNNRGFKCSVRAPEAIAGCDSILESVVREHLHRGSINLAIHLEREPGQTPVQINEAVLASYIRQCRAAITQADALDEASAQLNKVQLNSAHFNMVQLNIADLTSLPGVLSGSRPVGDQAKSVVEQVKRILVAALDDLVTMREREGAHMADSLLSDCATIAGHVRTIERTAPLAADNYRARLESKVNRILADFDAQINTVDLLREVQIYADKADVSEEITRLDSHLNLFQSVLLGESADSASSVRRDGPRDSQREEPVGRKLDFIIQEMFRETNTIGSKSAHSEVSAVVVEIKCAIERMRELVQNLE